MGQNGPRFALAQRLNLNYQEVMRRWMIWAAALTLVGRSVLAEETDTASKADETFRAGRELLKDKHYAEACAKFEQSEAQDPASGTLLALAYCQELSGLLATSWASYGAAAELAAREGQPERQTAAQERVEALAARLSRLTVVVPAQLIALPGFHLTRNGAEFERASFGLAVPLDGGTHVFSASAPGRVTWTSTVTLAPEHDEKRLVLPDLDAAQPAAVVAAPAPPPLAKPATSPPPPAPVEDSPDVRLQRVSLAVAAGSVVALGLGTAFGLSAKSKNDASNADGHCDSRGCDAQGVRLRNESLTAARVSTWSFVTGGALAAASLSLYLASTRSRSASSATRVQANVSLSESQISLLGSF